jgi:hypothetical protein
VFAGQQGVRVRQNNQQVVKQTMDKSSSELQQLEQERDGEDNIFQTAGSQMRGGGSNVGSD